MYIYIPADALSQSHAHSEMLKSLCCYFSFLAHNQSPKFANSNQWGEGGGGRGSDSENEREGVWRKI